MVLSREVPAQSVNQVYELRSVTLKRLFMLQDLDDVFQDLEELITNAFFSDLATAFSTCQVVRLLHSVVAKCTLEPLNQVKDARLIVT